MICLLIDRELTTIAEWKICGSRGDASRRLQKDSSYAKTKRPIPSDEQTVCAAA
jgi:hypothetical protein